MRTLIIDKIIVLDHQYESIEQGNFIENFLITAQNSGLECSGYLEFTATGKMNDEEYPIKELIDVSIFAPYHKLVNHEQFSVKLSEAQTQLKDNELHCSFQFHVSGLKEDAESDFEQKETEEASLEDLLDESEVVFQKVNYGISYANDTYASLAKRYGVDELQLKRLNHDKSLTARTLIVLPSC